MTLWRNCFLAFLFVLAQLGASAHALEHTLEEGHVQPHACVLCLEAHDLGAALPAVPPALSVPPSSHWHMPALAHHLARLRALQPRQGAPPST